MSAPQHSTLTVPKRSASAPAKGEPTPHKRFWMATAKPNTSRPQPNSCDMGSRNRPNTERGPKVSRATAEPAMRMRMAGTAPLRPEAAGGEVGADIGVVSRWEMHTGGAR